MATISLARRANSHVQHAHSLAPNVEAEFGVWPIHDGLNLCDIPSVSRLDHIEEIVEAAQQRFQVSIERKQSWSHVSTSLRLLCGATG